VTIVGVVVDGMEGVDGVQVPKSSQVQSPLSKQVHVPSNTQSCTGQELVNRQSDIVGVEGIHVPMSKQVHVPVSWQGQVPVRAQSGTHVPSSKQLGEQVPSSWHVGIVTIVGVEGDGRVGVVTEEVGVEIGQLPKSSQVQSPLSKQVQFP
jgi:hypothetical protein